MKNMMKRLWSEDEAANAVEYGIITAVVAVFLIGVLVVFRNQIRSLFVRTGNDVAGAQ